MPMHPAVRNDPHEMRCATAGFEFGGEVQNSGVLKETFVLNRKINLPQVHRDHAACSNIGMANFGIAHLSAGQTSIRAMGD